MTDTRVPCDTRGETIRAGHTRLGRTARADHILRRGGGGGGRGRRAGRSAELGVSGAINTRERVIPGVLRPRTTQYARLCYHGRTMGSRRYCNYVVIIVLVYIFLCAGVYGRAESAKRNQNSAVATKYDLKRLTRPNRRRPTYGCGRYSREKIVERFFYSRPRPC